MKQTKQQLTSNVVPFTGEMYPNVAQPVNGTNNTTGFLVMVAAALIGGLSVGAISTYQSADQVRLRQLEAQGQQLEQVKNQVCR